MNDVQSSTPGTGTALRTITLGLVLAGMGLLTGCGHETKKPPAQRMANATESDTLSSFMHQVLGKLDHISDTVDKIFALDSKQAQACVAPKKPHPAKLKRSKGAVKPKAAEPISADKKQTVQQQPAAPIERVTNKTIYVQQVVVVPVPVPVPVAPPPPVPVYGYGPGPSVYYPPIVGPPYIQHYAGAFGPPRRFGGGHMRPGHR